MGVFTGGLGSQFGYKKESVYGTYQAPTRWCEYLPGETLKRTQNYLRPAGLAAGVQVARGARTAGTSRMAGGAFSMEVPDNMFGGLVYLLHGEEEGEAKPAKEAATSVYKQVHNIGVTDPSKKSVSMQFGKPNITGTVESYSYLGSILTGMQFACSVDNYLTAAMTVDARDETTAEALGTFAPTTGTAGFTWKDTEVKVNGVKQEFCKGFTLNLTRPADTGRFYLGTGALKAQPLTNAFAQYTCSLTVDYAAQTLYKFFEKAEATKVEIICLGRTVEALKTEIKFLLEEARFEGDSPNVANQGALQQEIPLFGEYNGTVAPVKITIKSEDTAL